MIWGLIFSETKDKNAFDAYDEILFYNEKNILKSLKKCSNVEIYFDFEKNLDKNLASRYIKAIKKLENLLNKNKINFVIKNQYDIENTKNEFECYVLIAAYAMQIINKKERLLYLYNEICKFLDYQFVSKNLCDFKDNKCFAKRNCSVEMGCCHHCKNKIAGVLLGQKFELCEYQKDKKCQADCITCKMFVCDDIQNKGINFTTRNVLVIKYFFNFIQKLIIKMSFFTKKETIIKRLIIFE